MEQHVEAHHHHAHMRRKRNYKAITLKSLLLLYFCISQAMAIVYFFRFCERDNLAEIVTVDIILSELKGLFWFLFIF